MTTPDAPAPAIGEVTEEIEQQWWAAFLDAQKKGLANRPCYRAALEAVYPLIAQQERARVWQEVQDIAVRLYAGNNPAVNPCYHGAVAIANIAVDRLAALSPSPPMPENEK